MAPERRRRPRGAPKRKRAGPSGGDRRRGRTRRDGDGRREPAARGARAPRPPRKAGTLPREVVQEIRASAGTRAPKAIRLLEEASEAMARERWSDAQRLAGQAKAAAPRSGMVREALGLALYRGGRYRDAIRELQAYRRITGRPDQNHLLADAHRAEGSPQKAIPLAQEALRAQRIPAEARAEAAVVGGAALADMGRFEEALSILRRFDRSAGATAARPHDLRVWYVMGDVLERAGRGDEAADRFRRILRHDPDAYDVAERLAALS